MPWKVGFLVKVHWRLLSTCSLSTFYRLVVSTHFMLEPMRYRGIENGSVCTFYWLVHI